MSDETTPEAAVASGPAASPIAAPRSESPADANASGGDTAPRATSGPTSGGDATDPNGAPKRRRRRGSRGGRNRRKPGTGTGGTGTNGAGAPGASDDDADDEFDDDEPNLGHDYTDAAADRGMTTDDVAEVAMEEAGVAHTPRAPRAPRPPRPDAEPASAASPAPAAADPASAEAPKPRIGDSRPGPAASATSAPTNGGATDPGDGTAAPKRRRRRGGRGRGRGGSGGAGGGTGAGGAGGAGGTGGGGTAPGGGNGRVQQQSQPRNKGDVVRADLGVGEAPGAPLDDDVLERRRGRTRKGRPAGRYLMCVHVLEGGHTHIAVLEGRSLVEHSLATPTGNESIDGNIYYGRVQNVLPGMEAAFIDIGTPKNGVLYRGDVAFDKADLEGGNKPKIERALKNGQMITVQVTKNPIAHKGARLTQEVSLAGRFLVMVPNEPDTYGISKRLPDDERKRLRKVLDGIRPDDAGLIVRTAAEGATSDELERDVRRLRNQWEQISALTAQTKSAKLLYQEPDLVLRRIREEFTKEYRGVVIDDRALYEEVRGYVEAITPELAERVEYYDAEEEGLPIFERFHISEQLLKALDRKVWLPSGGSLIIERTEALTVIDVNTGKNVGKSNLEETVFRNNLEAAEEVARQLRLRDIGGIIVIDFVDMEIKRNRDEVMKVFRDALARDKTRTQAFEMSELGLVEMTRKRISEGLVESFSSTCPSCHGRGFLLDESLLESME
ncbi:MAG TPA: Rne/Rng family ribonuclease [Acidimicrobiia bacterium]